MKKVVSYLKHPKEIANFVSNFTLSYRHQSYQGMFTTVLIYLYKYVYSEIIAEKADVAGMIL